MIISKKYTIPLFALFFIFLLLLMFNYKSVGKRPELTSISKSVANPGDTITLIGNYFGGEISRGRVYINGKMVYKDFIKSWDNKAITLTLTENFKSGMISVDNMFGESTPYLITSFKDVPIVDNSIKNIGIPNIINAEYLNNTNLKIHLEGNFFGVHRNSSTIKVSNTVGEEIIIDNSLIIDWSDNNITFYLPYSMEDIFLTILSSKGYSNVLPLHNTEIPSVTYNISNSKSYVIEQTTDITDVIALKDSYVKLFMPTAIIDINQKCEIIDLGSGKYNKFNKTVDYIVPVDVTGYEISLNLKSKIEVSAVESNIRTDLIGRTYDTSSPHYIDGYQKTPNVEQSKDLKNTSVWLVRETNNIYRQMETIIDWVLKYIKVSSEGSSDATIGFKNRSVSNFGLINLTASMLRSIGIPTRIISGVKEDETWVNYKWLEFYLPDGGWIPLDLLQIKEDPSYKIGSLENNRICFTKGVTILEYEKDSFIDDFYALQNSTSNFEGNIDHYRAIWHNVIVK